MLLLLTTNNAAVTSRANQQKGANKLISSYGNESGELNRTQSKNLLVQRVTIYVNYGKSSINVGAEHGKSVINGGVKRREPVAKRGEKFHLVAGQRKKCNRSWCQAR